MDMKTFEVGERISYMGKTGTVSRINVLGLRPCCAIQIDWDDSVSMKRILQMKELKHVSKI